MIDLIDNGTAPTDADLIIMGTNPDEGSLPLVTIKGDTGNTGFGTTEPEEKVTIEGNLKVNGAIIFKDNTRLTTYEGDFFPSGGIIMWSGSLSNIPSGWVLCNGDNGTPDLRDKFIIGAGGNYNYGASGGSSTHNHGVGSYACAHHSHSAGTLTVSQAIGGYVQTGTHRTATENHAHIISGSTGQSAPVINGISSSASSLPPYYSLAYIMKL